MKHPKPAVNTDLCIQIGIAGREGRMGSLLVQELQSDNWPGLSYAAGTAAGDDPEKLFQACGLVIDFTTPEATRRHIALAARHNKPLVIGTTGLTEKDETMLRDAARDAPLLYAANMSIGVTLLSVLVEQAAARLGTEFDVEIAESHHRHKIDAPSGTALALGKAAAKARNADFEQESVMSRHGRTGARKPGTIGFSVQRGGDVIGEHTVSFLGDGEQIALTHKATDRCLFARGALRAALWLKDRPNGLYDMRDVLGL